MVRARGSDAGRGAQPAFRSGLALMLVGLVILGYVGWQLCGTTWVAMGELVIPFTGTWVLITLTTCSELFPSDDPMIAFGHLVRTVEKDGQEDGQEGGQEDR